MDHGTQTREQRATFERLHTSSAFRGSEGLSAKVILHRTNDPMEVAIGNRTWRVESDGHGERIVDPEGDV